MMFLKEIQFPLNYALRRCKHYDEVYFTTARFFCIINNSLLTEGRREVKGLTENFYKHTHVMFVKILMSVFLLRARLYRILNAYLVRQTSFADYELDFCIKFGFHKCALQLLAFTRQISWEMLRSEHNHFLELISASMGDCTGLSILVFPRVLGPNFNAGTFSRFSKLVLQSECT